MSINNWLRKRTEYAVTSKPKFTAIEKITIALSAGILLGSLKFGGVAISTATLVGFGTVFGMAIVVYKFEFVRLLILWGGRWLDFSLLLVSLLLAGSMFGLMTSTFAGIFFSAYLAINRYVTERKIWKVNHGRI